jgi:hypothetical protein
MCRSHLTENSDHIWYKDQLIVCGKIISVCNTKELNSCMEKYGVTNVTEDGAHRYF